MEYRKIKFYKLNGEEANGNKLKTDEIVQFIDQVLENGTRTDDEHICISHQINKKAYVIEVIEKNDTEIFLRIRQPRPKNHYGKADMNNFTLMDLNIDDNEHMESYTSIYLDLVYMILSHLQISGTPSIGIFEQLINRSNECGNGIMYHCDAIATDKIIEQIVNKGRLGMFTYSFSMPEEEVLADVPGLTDKIRREMHVNRGVIEVKLSPNRRGSLFKKNSTLVDLMDNLRKKYGSNLKKATIKAADFDDERLVSFNLLNQEFTQETTIKADDEINIDEYYRKIKEAYNIIKNTLIRYIPDID